MRSNRRTFLGIGSGFAVALAVGGAGTLLGGCGSSDGTREGAKPGQSSSSPAASSANTVESQTQKVPVEGGGSYADVSAVGLAAMLEKKDFPLINVHIPYEGEIEGTDLFIPYNEVEANLDKLPADKGAKLVLYCRSGSMSGIAARALVKRGYADVWNLDGGTVAWVQAGYAIVNKRR